MAGMKEIAQGLIVNPQSAETEAQDATPEQEDDTSLLDTAVEPMDSDDDLEETSESDDEDDEISPADGEDEDEAEDESEGDDDEPFILDVDDDDLVEVMIDGEMQLMSLSALKKAASGEGAIEKRLQQATEKRKEADAYRATSEDVINQQRAVMTAVVQQLDQMLFGNNQLPQVDESLKQTNPGKYLMQITERDQAKNRMEEGRNQLRSLVQQMNEGVHKSAEAFRKQQAEELAKKLPVFRDQEKGPKRVQLVTEKAKNVYGFTDEELQLVSDSRLMHVLHDAAMYSAANAGEVEQATKPTQKRKTPAKKSSNGRVLRPGVQSNAAKRAAVKEKNERAAKRDKARKSGKVEDVAANLIVTKPRARRS